MATVSSALATQQSLGNLLPLWWFIFTKQRDRSRIAALVNSCGLLLSAYYTAGELRKRLQPRSMVETAEAAENHLAWILLSGSLVACLARTWALVQFAHVGKTK